MVACPKCGFEQPKDQYCAKCGVDIDRFERRQNKFGRAFFLHPLFLSSCLFVVVVLSIFMARQKSRSGADDSGSLSRSRLWIYSSSSDEKESDSSEGRRPASELAMASKAISAAVDPSSAPPKEDKNPEKTSDVRAKVKTAAANSFDGHSIELRVYFLEVLKSQVEFYAAESITLNQYIDLGDFKAGILSDLPKKIADKRFSKLVHQSEVKKLSAGNMNLIWFEGIAKDDAKIGLEFGVSLQDFADSDLIRGTLELNRFLKDDEIAPIVKKPYQSTPFVVKPPYGWMTILSPPVVTYAGAEAFGPLGWLQIFRSSEFKDKKQTDLLILYDFKKK